MTSHIVVLVTTESKEQAETIAGALVEEKLAACVNIVEKTESCFRWEGRVDRVSECLLIIKSRKELFPVLKNKVKELHSYDVPEILALPVVDGSEEYLTWIDESTR